MDNFDRDLLVFSKTMQGSRFFYRNGDKLGARGVKAFGVLPGCNELFFQKYDPMAEGA